MRFVLTLCLLITAVIQGNSAFAQPDTGQTAEKQLDADLQKPLDYWLAQIRSPVAQERDRAVQVLSTAAGLVQTLHMFHAKATSEAMIRHPDFSEQRREFLADVNQVNTATRYVSQFQQSLDRMIEMLEPLLHEQNVGFNVRTAGSVLAHCIAVSYPDGSGIVRARRRLPEGYGADQLLEHLIFCTGLTMPREQTVHAVLIPEFRRLSPEMKVFLAEEWKRAHEGGDGGPTEPADLRHLSLGLYAMGILSSLSDRFQREMPLFLESLRPEHPQIIRCASIACLATMHWEAEPALPSLRKLLDDESITIRHLVAMAIVNIELDPGRTDELAKQVGMTEDQRAEFKKLAVEAKDEWLRDGSLDLVTPGHKDFSEECLQYFESGPESNKRMYLRIIRSEGPAAESFEPQIRKCLMSKDPLTQEFAEKALKAICQENQE